MEDNTHTHTSPDGSTLKSATYLRCQQLLSEYQRGPPLWVYPTPLASPPLLLWDATERIFLVVSRREFASDLDCGTFAQFTQTSCNPAESTPYS